MRNNAHSFKEFAAEIAKDLIALRPMRRGSIGERWMKCGKESCACHHDPTARHGPYYSLTATRDGKTISRYVSKRGYDHAKKQILAFQAFRKKVQLLLDYCEKWADEELDAIENAQKQLNCQRRVTKHPDRYRDS